MKKFLLSGFLLLLVSPMGFAQENSNDPLKTTQHVLPNGLTILLTENHNSAQIFGIVAVKAGGKNDPKEATGMAHYLEHMLFKGTEELGTWDFPKEKVHLDKIEALYEDLGKTSDEAKRAEIQKNINDEAILAGKYAIPNEMDRMLSEIGGTNVNAFTTEDFTAYHNEFPSNKLEHWLKIYDHRFEKPVFRLFQSELETVYEEKNRSMDSPFSEVLDKFNKNFWKNHPYGQQPIIGHTEHLKNPSLQKMYDYFKTYYVANNMVLALSGDFDTQEALRLIELYFSDWRTGQIPVFPDYPEAEFNGKEKIEIKATPVKAFLRGYRAPENNHPDQKKLQIANYLLSNSEGSGLLDMLGNEGKLSYSGMIPMEYNDYGASVIFGVPKIIGQSFEEAEKLLDEQLTVLKNGTFELSFFEGAKTSMIKDFQRQLESNESRALMLVSAFTSNTDWNVYLERSLELKKISKEDIVAVANKYYGENYLALYSNMGTPKKDKLNKPQFEAVIPEDGKVSEFCKAWKNTSTPELKAGFVDFEKDISRIRSGDKIELRAVNNPFNEIFNLNFSWGTGTESDSLLFYLPSYLGKLGTESKSALEFKKSLFELGASINFGSNENTFSLYVEGIDSKLPETIALISDFFNHYKMDDKVIATISNEVSSDRKLSNKDPNFLMGACRDYALYGKNSKYLREIESANIRKIKSSDLVNSFQNVLTYGLEINYTGTYSLQNLNDQLKPILSKFTPVKARMERKNTIRNGFESPKVYFLDDKKAVQSQIMFLMDGKPMSLDMMGDQIAFNLYFGGDMSSIVFQEIREFRSLAYSTSAIYTLADKPGKNNYFYAYIGCQGDKTPEALEVMNDLIQNMPVKREREEGIRASLISDAKTNKPGFRNLIQTVDLWQKMGYDEDPNKILIPYYTDISFDQIEAFYKNQIQGRNMQLIVVGNSKKFDKKILEKYGKLISLKSSQVVKN